MDFQTVLAHMWIPWTLGIFLICAVYFSKNREMVRITPKGVFKFFLFMLVLSVFRYVLLKNFASQETLDHAAMITGMIPWQSTLGVFWEDAVFAMPLAVLREKVVKTSQYWTVFVPFLLLSMFVFGSGHTYQGNIAAGILSLYVPLSVTLGRKHGFGTMMICHIMYDMMTLLLLKWMVGA